jgi:hypothetical protein
MYIVRHANYFICKTSFNSSTSFHYKSTKHFYWSLSKREGGEGVLGQRATGINDNCNICTPYSAKQGQEPFKSSTDRMRNHHSSKNIFMECQKHTNHLIDVLSVKNSIHCDLIWAMFWYREILPRVKRAAFDHGSCCSIPYEISCANWIEIKFLRSNKMHIYVCYYYCFEAPESTYHTGAIIASKIRV